MARRSPRAAATSGWRSCHRWRRRERSHSSFVVQCMRSHLGFRLICHASTATLQFPDLRLIAGARAMQRRMPTCWPKLQAGMRWPATPTRRCSHVFVSTAARSTYCRVRARASRAARQCVNGGRARFRHAGSFYRWLGAGMHSGVGATATEHDAWWRAGSGRCEALLRAVAD